MRAYSEDLRKKIVSAIQRGMPKSQAARLFSISLSSVKRYTRLADEESSNTQEGRWQTPHSRGRYQEASRGGHTHKTGGYRRGQAPLPRDFAGKSLSESTLRRLLKRLGFTRKNGRWGRWNETNG